MIKCPHCGSTAQVKLINHEITVPSNEWTHFYECGCGCKFARIIRVVEEKILSTNLNKSSQA